MNFLAQAIQERATQLSYEADESVEDVGDMVDVDSDIYQSHEEAAEDVNQLENYVDDLEASQQAEVTLESLTTILQKSLGRGGLTQSELECFAVAQSAIGQTLKVSVSAIPDLQSYGRLGAYEYTALSAEQTEQAKKGVVEKIKAILKKIVDFVVRIYHKVTFSTKRIQDKAQKLIKELNELPPHVSELPNITDPSIIKALSIPQFSVHALIAQFEAAARLHHMVEGEIEKVIKDPGHIFDERMVMSFIAESQKIRVGDFPIFKEVSDDRPISERLKFWKREAPQKLPESLPVLATSDIKILLDQIKDFQKQKPILNVGQLQQRLDKMVEVGMDRHRTLMNVYSSPAASVLREKPNLDEINRDSTHWMVSAVMPHLLRYCTAVNLSKAKYAFYLLKYCEACINAYKKAKTSNA